MVTIMRNNEFANAMGDRLSPPETTFVDPLAIPRKRLTFWQRVGRKFAGCVPWLCGVEAADWFVAEDDQKKFHAMRDDMRISYGIATHMPGEVDPSIVGAMILAERQSGRELSEPALVMDKLYERFAADDLTGGEFDLTVRRLRLNEALQSTSYDVTGRVPVWSSRFAAAMVLSLRAKFGPLERNEANVMLVGREYRSICRRNFVRMNVINDHAPFVTTQFFQQTAAEQRLAARRRLPRWLVRTLDDTQLSGAGVLA